MTRLLINLFFIVIICFTLAAMPINTQILEMFDFGELFSKEVKEVVEPELETPETFEANFTYALETNIENRLYNPSNLTLNLTTNITEAQEEAYDLKDFELVLYRNNEIYQIFDPSKFLIDENKTYSGDFIKMVYEINLSKASLLLNQEGFYTAVLRAKSNQGNLLSFDVAYLSDFDFVAPSDISNNYAYKAYFYNAEKTATIPLSLNMNYPESTTTAVRNSLYSIPSEATGLAQQQVIPNRSSLSRIGDGHYAVYFSSSELEDFVTNEEEARLMIEAFTKTMLNLPHIDKISLYVDNRQEPASLYGIDLSKVYEKDLTAKVYLPGLSNNKTYLLPYALASTTTNDLIFEIIAALQNGGKNDQSKQVLPSEVTLNNILMEGSQVTLDFNNGFLTAFPNLESYKTLMVQSLLYSITSIDGIETLSITIDGETLTNYAGFNFSMPVKPLKFINYIGEF